MVICSHHSLTFRAIFETLLYFSQRSPTWKAHSDIRQQKFFLGSLSGKAHSDIRQKEVISGRFPITKSELARCCLRDEGPV